MTRKGCIILLLPSSSFATPEQAEHSAERAKRLWRDTEKWSSGKTAGAIGKFHCTKATKWLVVTAA